MEHRPPHEILVRPEALYHPLTSDESCGGYDVAADGGCPNVFHDPWVKVVNFTRHAAWVCAP